MKYKIPHIRYREGDRPPKVTSKAAWFRVFMQSCISASLIVVALFAPASLFAQDTEKKSAVVESKSSATSAPRSAPIIERAVPSVGGPGQYVTLFGKNLGYAPGEVQFVQRDATVIADTAFPRKCQGMWWRDTAVVVRVPGNAAPGQYSFSLSRSDGAAVASEVKFTVSNASPSPGICGISPDNGPEGIPITVFGSGFGSKQGTVRVGQKDLEIKEGGWRIDSVTAVSPSAAADPIVLISSNKTLSNPFPFIAARCSPSACGEGQTCCSDGSCRPSGRCVERRALCSYSWNFFTGTFAKEGEACSSNEQCASGVCGADKKCARGVRGEQESCTLDSQCREGLRCEKNICISAKKPVGAACTVASECASRVCSGGECIRGTKSLGSACSSGDECASGNCRNGVCSQPVQCLSVQRIEPASGAVRESSVFTATFNQLVRHETVPPNFSIEPGVKGTFEYRSLGSGDRARTQVAYRPSKPLDTSKKYTIRLGNDIKAASSENTLGRCVERPTGKTGGSSVGRVPKCVGKPLCKDASGALFCAEAEKCSSGSREVNQCGEFPLCVDASGKEFCANGKSCPRGSKEKKPKNTSVPTKIRIYANNKPLREDAFGCFGNSCVGDRNTGAPGNQHAYTAVVFDDTGKIFPVADGGMTWRLSGGTEIFSLSAQRGRTIQATNSSTEGAASLIVRLEDYDLSASIRLANKAPHSNCATKNCSGGPDKPGNPAMLETVVIESDGSPLSEDVYGCGGTGCADDADAKKNGVQHGYAVRLHGQNNSFFDPKLVKDIRWSVSDTSIVALSATTGRSLQGTHQNKKGTATLTVRVTPREGHGEAVTASVTLTVDITTICVGGACGPVDPKDKKKKDGVTLSSIVFAIDGQEFAVGAENDAFGCIGDFCPDDRDSNKAGNQHEYAVVLFGSDGKPFAARDSAISWTLEGDSDAFSLEQKNGKQIAITNKEPSKKVGDTVVSEEAQLVVSVEGQELTGVLRLRNEVPYLICKNKECNDGGNNKPGDPKKLGSIVLEANRKPIDPDSFTCYASGKTRCAGDRDTKKPGTQHAYAVRMHAENNALFKSEYIEKIEWEVDDEKVLTLDGTSGVGVMGTNTSTTGETKLHVTVTPKAGHGEAKQASITIKNTLAPLPQKTIKKIIISANGKEVAADAFGCRGSECEDDRHDDSGNQHRYKAIFFNQDDLEVFPAADQILWKLSGNEDALQLSKNDGAVAYVSNGEKTGRGTLSVSVRGETATASIRIENKEPYRDIEDPKNGGGPNAPGNPALLGAITIDSDGSPLSTDVFACGGDACEDDNARGDKGVQHVYSVRAHGQNNAIFSADHIERIEWKLSNESVMTLSSTDKARVVGTSTEKKGSVRLSVTVTPKKGHGSPKTTRITVTNHIRIICTADGCTSVDEEEEEEEEEQCEEGDEDCEKENSNGKKFFGSVSLYIQGVGSDATAWRPLRTDSFSCLSECPDDRDIDKKGVQHVYKVVVKDKEGTEHTPENGTKITVSWTESGDDNGIVALESPTNKQTATVTSSGKNGSASIKATVTWKDGDDTETVTATADIKAFICNVLWPTSDGREADALRAYDIDLKYCRGNQGQKLLPALSVARPLDDNLLSERYEKEYIFTLRSDDPALPNTDAIFVRIAENSAGSLEQWYAANVSRTGAPRSLSVGGLPAIQDSFGTYVASLSGTENRQIVVAFMHNTNPAPATLAVYRELLDASVFMSSKDAATREKARRDMKRLDDISAIVRLVDARSGGAPTLEQGTYVSGQTFSTWPSWISTLGNLFGRRLPIDPFASSGSSRPQSGVVCPGGASGGYDPITCWNPVSRTIGVCPGGKKACRGSDGNIQCADADGACPGGMSPTSGTAEDLLQIGSYGYSYMLRQDGQYRVCARFEYLFNGGIVCSDD